MKMQKLLVCGLVLAGLAWSVAYGQAGPEDEAVSFVASEADDEGADIGDGQESAADEADVPFIYFEGPDREVTGTLLPYATNGEAGVMVISPEEVFSDKGAPVYWDESWPYASYSQIHTGHATLYRKIVGNGYTVCVNAGHGTAGGASVRTLCHPDGSAKVTGGSTGAGAIYATAISYGTTMQDGTTEGVVNLQLAMILKEKLLHAGFHVLMIRESDDVQLDNIARTVIANQNADCHLSLHYDSTAYDKGFFVISVPDVYSYRHMEPVASHWQEHNALAESILAGVRGMGNRIYGSGNFELALTQTSYATIPSVDVECGDTASDWSKASQEKIADGIVKGLISYFNIDPAWYYY